MAKRVWTKPWGKRKYCPPFGLSRKLEVTNSSFNKNHAYNTSVLWVLMECFFFVVLVLSKGSDYFHHCCQQGPNCFSLDTPSDSNEPQDWVNSNQQMINRHCLSFTLLQPMTSCMTAIKPAKSAQTECTTLSAMLPQSMHDTYHAVEQFPR